MLQLLYIRVNQSVPPGRYVFFGLIFKRCRLAVQMFYLKVWFNVPRRLIAKRQI